MKNCLIIGGGASGLMCAYRLIENSSNDALRVTIIEHKDNLGYKLLASGNGRCNLSNILPTDEFISYGFSEKQQRFVKSAIYDFPPTAQLEFFAANGVEVVLVDDFHYFPKSQRSADVLNVFKRKIASAKNLQILYGKEVQSINVDNGIISSVMLDNQEVKCDFLVIATGGVSYAATGSNGSIFPLLKNLGLNIVDPLPALVGLQVDDCQITALAGNVLKNAEVTSQDIPSVCDNGELLFTQTGVSGPAILDLSGKVSRLLHEGRGNIELSVNLDVDYNQEYWFGFFEEKRRSAGKKSVRNLLHEFFFLNLVDLVLEKSSVVPERKIAELNKNELNAIVANLTALKLKIVGTDGLKKAIVTVGGVDLKEVNGKTLESKKVKNLFFAGEVLDVDGRCGGYNLTWAFASGAKVASVIERKLIDYEY